jgi:hypothetical protein
VREGEGTRLALLEKIRARKRDGDSVTNVQGPFLKKALWALLQRSASAKEPRGKCCADGTKNKCAGSGDDGQFPYLGVRKDSVVYPDFIDHTGEKVPI